MLKIHEIGADEKTDIVVRLEEIQQEMLELLDEAEGMMRGTTEEVRAKSYWLAHIKTALIKEHEYLGGSMITMEDSINSLRENDTVDN